MKQTYNAFDVVFDINSNTVIQYFKHKLNYN